MTEKKPARKILVIDDVGEIKSETLAALQAAGEAAMQNTQGHIKYICYTPGCGTTIWSPVRPECCPKCKKVSHERDRLQNADAIMFPGLGRKREAVPVAPMQLSERARRRMRRRKR